MKLWIPHRDNDFKRRLTTGLATLGLSFFVSLALQSSGFNQHYDEDDLDRYARTTPISRQLSDRITIVAVNEDDYREIFKKQSPLDQSKLLKLIRDVQSYHPRVIGVDFLTADWSRPLRGGDTFPEPPIVWAREGIENPEDGTAGLIPNLHGKSVAGFATPPPDLCYAPPINRPDSDGVIRRYLTDVTWIGEKPEGPIPAPSMARALASPYPDHELVCKGLGTGESKLIRFSGIHPFVTIAASEIRDFAHSPGFDRVFRDRIVLIGGTFAAARDRWQSSVGYLDGVQILAHSVESEMLGGIVEPKWWKVAALSFVASLVVFGCLFPVPQPWDTIGSALLPVFAVVVLGYFLYGFAHVFLGVTTWMIGVPISTAVQHYVELSDRLSSRSETNVSRGAPPISTGTDMDTQQKEIETE